MTLLREAQSLLDETVWNAWLKKGRLRDKADDRRYRRVAGVALYLTAVR
jgi:hypothetical protein